MCDIQILQLSMVFMLALLPGMVLSNKEECIQIFLVFIMGRDDGNSDPFSVLNQFQVDFYTGVSHFANF